MYPSWIRGHSYTTDVSGLVETNYSKETLGPIELESIIQLLSEYES